MSQVDPDAYRSAGEQAIEFLLGLAGSWAFWVLLIMVILGFTLIRHGWPWRRRP